MPNRWSFVPGRYFKPDPKLAGRGSSIGCESAWYADGRGFDPHVRQHSFVEIGHEIISKSTLSFPLIQEGKLSVNWRKNVH